MGTAQNSLSLEVTGVKSSEGKINVAVYDQPNRFLKFDKVFKSDSTEAKEGTTRLIISDLPEGEYAFAVFHNENGNDELDTNWLGIPREDVGFSNAKTKTFGPPSYKECTVPVSGDSEISVRIE